MRMRETVFIPLSIILLSPPADLPTFTTQSGRKPITATFVPCFLKDENPESIKCGNVMVFSSLRDLCTTLGGTIGRKITAFVLRSGASDSTNCPNLILCKRFRCLSQYERGARILVHSRTASRPHVQFSLWCSTRHLEVVLKVERGRHDVPT